MPVSIPSRPGCQILVKEDMDMDMISGHLNSLSFRKLNLLGRSPQFMCWGLLGPQDPCGLLVSLLSSPSACSGPGDPHTGWAGGHGSRLPGGFASLTEWATPPLP